MSKLLRDFFFSFLSFCHTYLKPIFLTFRLFLPSFVFEMSNEADKDVLINRTPLSLNYGNFGCRREKVSRTATSKSGINNVLADIRRKLFNSWRDGSTQAFLFYTKPTRKRQANDFWFIGPDAEKFRGSSDWNDGNGGGLQNNIESIQQLEIQIPRCNP
ncbi:Uncharacterized protein APZ42_030941 [Daphnia magna]|uniref:Uncharacterized protein n=1 Tax=Daphnia magna TaxID=35525 RepID=A0A164NAA6_9CRUS|nr:Uncharacterized protein APZ42_030941 [Daphnia magna]